MTSTGVGKILKGLRADELSVVLRAAVDQALVLDEDGMILEVLRGPSPVAGLDAWGGKDWRSTVTSESRPKLERLLDEIAETGVSRFRQVNHPVEGREDVPVGYTIVRIGSSGTLLAIGRNLEALASLQRQLVDAQQSMESEYWHVRQAEARYRLLFQQSTEPIFLVEGDGFTISDANTAAGELLSADSARLVGKTFPPPAMKVGPDFDGPSRSAFVDTLEQLALGTIDRATVELHIGERERPWILTASVVRFDGTRTILVRLETEAAQVEAGPGLDVLDLLDHSPDGFVVTDPDGAIQYANTAFLHMTQASSLDDLTGQSLGLWLARPGADLTVLLTNLKERGQIRLFSTEVEGEQGVRTPVEISAVAAFDAEEPVLGVTLRDVGRRLGPRRNAGEGDLNSAVLALTDQVGKVSLKQLVDDTVGLVELHFIDAALQLTGDNRTAAAELLGLSRQSLYTKLKRYNLDSNTEN